MRDYKGTNLSDRLKNSKQAKQLLLQKASEAPKPDDPTLAAQRAAAQAKAMAREAERLQRIEAKAAAAREKAEQKAAAVAALAEEEKRLAQQTAEQQAAKAAEQKAARDARYAARKKRQG